MKIVLCRKDLKRGSIHGGICAIYCHLAKELHKLGVEVFTVSSWKTGPSKKIRHYYVPYTNSANYRERIFYLLNKIDFDIIECSSWKAEGLEYARRKNRKPIVVRGDLSAFYFDNKIETNLEKELLILADYRLAVSRSCALDLEKKFGIKIDKFILNGVDTSSYNLKYRNNFKSKKLLRTIIWVGKPTFAKGFDMLMDLMKIAPKDLSFYIVFGNTSQNYSMKLIKNKNIRYYQNLSQEKMINLYNKSDVCLSTSRYESFGLAPLEAMACGTPVVVPKNVPSFGEYVRDGMDGFIYNDLNQVIEDIYKVEKLDFKKIRIHAHRFSWRKMAKETLEVYKFLLSK